MLIIPINAERAVYGMPWFTLGTVALCTISWLLSWNMDVFGPFGFVPGHELGVTVVLYAFAHGGFLHLLGNMIFLWCMGINLETRWASEPGTLKLPSTRSKSRVPAATPRWHWPGLRQRGQRRTVPCRQQLLDQRPRPAVRQARLCAPQHQPATAVSHDVS